MSWQKALANCISNPDILFQLLDLDVKYLPAARKAAELFPLRVPLGFIQRMKHADINDPLLNQVLPLQAEYNDNDERFKLDPLHENQFNPLPGLLHKYPNRVLLMINNACAVNCRYCFRRHFPYQENIPGSEGWNKIIEYIQQRTHVNEVILSGGDPLVVNDHHLKILLGKLSDIPHLKRLRIHSRLPIVLPERIDHAFIHAITQTKLKLILVIHCNHPQEIDSKVTCALAKLDQANITLLNQSVLLKNINDNSQALISLSEILFENHVFPYYLHLLDKVKGAKHFEVSESSAQNIMHEIKSQLPGYLVPKLVKEVAGQLYKSEFNLSLN